MVTNIAVIPIVISIILVIYPGNIRSQIQTPEVSILIEFYTSFTSIWRDDYDINMSWKYVQKI